MPTAVLTALLLAAVAAGQTPPAAGDAPDAKQPATVDQADPAQRTGTIQKLRAPMGRLMQLHCREGRIEVAFPKEPEQISTIVDEFRTITGYGGGGSTWGSNGYEFSLFSDDVEGRIARVQRENEFAELVLIEELKSPGRTFSLERKDSGECLITINDNEIGYLLRVRQRADGAFQVQELRGMDVFSGEAPSFDAFCRQHRQFLLESMVPVLEHFGLPRIQTPYSPHVQQQVAAVLRPWTEAESNVLNELTDGLDSGVYADREAAVKRIQSRLGENEELRGMVARMVLDKEFSPEVRARTRRLINAKLDEAEKRDFDFVAGLLDRLDANWLIELIELTPDPQERAVLMARLQVLLDAHNGHAANIPDSGIDLRSWDPGAETDMTTLMIHHHVNVWARDQVGLPQPEPLPDLLAEKGELQKVAEHTARLVRLTWHENQLAVDRAHWAAPFGGKTVKELIAEIEKSVADANLPAAWFVAGGEYDKGSVDYPQVLFEQMAAIGQPDPHSTRHYYRHGNRGNSSPNREFEFEALSGSMEFVRQNPNRRVSEAMSIKDKPFRFELEEKKSPSRMLLIDETKPGELRILLTGAEANFTVQLVLRDNLALIQDVRGTAARAWQAESFRQLLEQQPGYFRELFFPLLRHAGVEVDEAVMAPPDAHERTGP